MSNFLQYACVVVLGLVVSVLAVMLIGAYSSVTPSPSLIVGPTQYDCGPLHFTTLTATGPKRTAHYYAAELDTKAGNCYEVRFSFNTPQDLAKVEYRRWRSWPFSISRVQ